MMEKLSVTLDYMRRVGTDELTEVELLNLAATMLRNESDRELREAPEMSTPMLNPVARLLLIDLLVEEAGAIEDHYGPDEFNMSGLCRSELFALAVARAIVYPPAPYDTAEDTKAEVMRRYKKLEVPDA